VEQTQDAGVDGAQDEAGCRRDVRGAQDGRHRADRGGELWCGLVLFLMAHPPILDVVYFVGGASDIFEVKSWWGWVNTHHAK